MKLRRGKLIGCLTLIVGFTMVSIGMVIHNQNSYAKFGTAKVQAFDIKGIAANANMATEKEEPQVQEKKETTRASFLHCVRI